MSLGRLLRRASSRASDLLTLTPGGGGPPSVLDGEIIYSKNNVCVHSPEGLQGLGEHHPGEPGRGETGRGGAGVPGLDRSWLASRTTEPQLRKAAASLPICPLHGHLTRWPTPCTWGWGVPGPALRVLCVLGRKDKGPRWPVESFAGQCYWGGR